jgi:hypothetical protein
MSGELLVLSGSFSNTIVVTILPRRFAYAAPKRIFN